MGASIREQIKVAGLFQWQVAAKLGITEATLIRWLRFDVPEDRKRAILSAVEELEAERKAGSQ